MKSQGWEKPTDGAVRGGQHPGQDFVRYRVRPETLADVAPLSDDPVDGGPLVVGVWERTFGLFPSAGLMGSPC